MDPLGKVQAGGFLCLCVNANDILELDQISPDLQFPILVLGPAGRVGALGPQRPPSESIPTL